MIKNATIIRQFTWLSGFLILIIFSLGVFTFSSSSNLYELLEKSTTKSVPAIRNMVQADMLHDGLRAVVVESLYSGIKGDANAIKVLDVEVKEKSENFHKHIAALGELDLSDSTNKAIHETKPALLQFTEISQQIVSLVSQGQLENAEGKKSEFDKSFEHLETQLESLGDLIEKDAAQASTEGSSTLIMIGAITLAGISFGLILSLFVIRNLRRNVSHFLSQVTQSTETISNSSEKLSQSNNEFSANTTESSASLQETVASLEEISSMVKLNSDNAKKASEVSVESRDSAQKGEISITQLSHAMQDINKSSKKMEEIISVIDEIAFQTNLLALNAAVEAARAGEMGRGFAVVADAVRSLAQRSAAAAKDISQMIKESITKIETGTQVVESSREALNSIFVSVKEVSELNHQISNASQEQSEGIRQISEAMNQIDSATQRNATGAQEVAVISKEVLDQSKELKGLVFELNNRFLGQKSEKQKIDNVFHLSVNKKQEIQKMNSHDDFFSDTKKRKVGQLDQF